MFLTNQVEGKALMKKTTATVCQFLINDVIYHYGCIGRIMDDREELDAQEAEELFDRLGVKLSLTKAYNPKANGKIECGHRPTLVWACEGQVKNWPRLLTWMKTPLHSQVEGLRIPLIDSIYNLAILDNFQKLDTPVSHVLNSM